MYQYGMTKLPTKSTLGMCKPPRFLVVQSDATDRGVLIWIILNQKSSLML